MGFAEMLQQARKFRGFTQEQLAEEIGVTRQSISKWEMGDTYPETERLIQLAGKLDTSLDNLLKEEIQVVRGKRQQTNPEYDTDSDAIAAMFSERFPAKKHRK